MTQRELLSRSPFSPNGQLPGSLELAYLGDVLFEMYVRARLVATGHHVKVLHRRAISVVCASAQSDALSRIEGMLTEPEAAVVRRARNAHQSPPRNADAVAYHRATALEALIGYLYATGQLERLDEIMHRALEGAL